MNRLFPSGPSGVLKGSLATEVVRVVQYSTLLSAFKVSSILVKSVNSYLLFSVVARACQD